MNWLAAITQWFTEGIISFSFVRFLGALSILILALVGAAVALPTFAILAFKLLRYLTELLA